MSDQPTTSPTPVPSSPVADRSVRCSLIVLNYNQRDLVLDCVESMLAAVGPADEVIVVDSCSDDGSADAVMERFPSVRVVRLPENRYIFGLNDGLALARGEFVAFCNNDMVVEAGFVERALECFAADDVMAVCARVLDRNGDEQGTRTSGAFEHGLLVYHPLPHVEWVTSCFFAVGGQSFFRRVPLLELGSIDELLWPMYHEDIELSYRIWKAGYRIVYAPGSICHHLGSQTSVKVFTKVELRSFVRQNELLTVWKNITDGRLLAGHVLWCFPRVFMALVRRDRGTLLGTWHALQRLPRALRSRRGARATAVLSDRQVLALVGTDAIEHSGAAG